MILLDCFMLKGKSINGFSSEMYGQNGDEDDYEEDVYEKDWWW